MMEFKLFHQTGDEVVPVGNQFIYWLSAKPMAIQIQVAKDQFQCLLVNASQPKYTSGSACVKLCYFLEQCRKSDSKVLRELVFSEATCLALTTFYIEWNEKNQHRPMRQVLDLIATLITTNPNKSMAKSVKLWILRRTLSIITHQSALPLVKPSLKALECFLHKSAVSIMELIEVYGEISAPRGPAIKLAENAEVVETTELDFCVSDIFEWMCLPDTSPAAGKLIVTLFQALRNPYPGNILCGPKACVALLSRWIRSVLSKHPNSLENIKNHIFSPLFKINRPGSLEFLYYLTEQTTIDVLESQDLNAQALLLLSAMEVGKKSGLVEGPDASILRKELSKAREYVVFPEGIAVSLLEHPSSTVRVSSLSVLVSSTSSTKPIPTSTFGLLQRHLSALHADSDARFRNEVLSNMKHVIERLRGAILYLSRGFKTPTPGEKPIRGLKPQISMTMDSTTLPDDKGLSVELNLHEENLLKHHIDFLQWYMDFLLSELIPTTSYQRHITALKALQILLRSGILEAPPLSNGATLNRSRSAWPFTLDFFTEKTMRLLLDLLMDPFEDVRNSAASILKLAPRKAFNSLMPSRSGDEPSSCLSSSQSSGSTTYEDSIYKGEVGNLKEDDFKNAKIPNLLFDFIKRAEDKYIRTGRADLADGVAHSYELLCTLLATDHARLSLVQSLVESLESKIAIAEADLAQAVLLAPVHGHFSSLRLVLGIEDKSLERASMPPTFDSQLKRLVGVLAEKRSDWEDMKNRIVQCCERIWFAVKEILCNDSPEGHLPQDLDGLDVIDTKNVLSYSFRAVHESSNLLCMMVDNPKSGYLDGSLLLPFDLFRAVGNLSFEQLSNLRHRGAFSTVSLTFAKCCQLVQNDTIYGLFGTRLLEDWYQGTLACINQQISTTRRSAGIPALMGGILSAKPPQAFEEVMVELKILARSSNLFPSRDETNLPQVHAINCLKEIFKSSALGMRCESHITDCIQLAADSLKSEIWAIRNCGLLLLRSLIDCLFGTSESKVAAEAGWDGRSVRLSYERYLALPELLLRLLSSQSEQETSTSCLGIGVVESVFPALDIIRRAGPPERLRDEIYICVSSHLASKIWHVRDIAARTICTLLLQDNWLPSTIKLIETCEKSVNQQHGVLMSVKYLLERQLELKTATRPEDLLILFTTLFEHYGRWRVCEISEAAYEEIVVILLKFLYLSVGDTLTSPNPEILTLKGLLLTRDAVKKASAILRQGNSMTPRSAFKSLSDSPFMSLALLRKALVLRALYTVANGGQISELESLMEVAAIYDMDSTRALLEYMPLMWNIQQTPAEALIKILELYIVAYTLTASSEVRSKALQNVSDVLEQLLKTRGLDWIDSTNRLQALRSSIITKGSPDLLSSEIQITGSLLVLDIMSARKHIRVFNVDERIEEWGYMLLVAGKANNEFDTRFAAVSALRCFFHSSCISLRELHNKSSFVPSFLALYDTLNDDDEDIRVAGAEVVSHMFGTSLVPLAAASKLLTWLGQNFTKTEAFHIAALQRVTGNEGLTALRFLSHELVSAEKQLKVAMLNDDSLFIEEEQNLYLDEVREAIAWTRIITSERSLWIGAATALSSWALEGILAITRLAENCDGPLGQTSTPRVFSICMHVILIAKIVLSCSLTEFAGNVPESLSMLKNIEESASRHVLPGHEELHRAINHLVVRGAHNNFHPTLLDALQK